MIHPQTGVVRAEREHIGVTMHLMYVGVSTPFVVGGPAHNDPE